MIESKKQGKENEEKFIKFKEDIQNEKRFLSKINQLFTDEYDIMLEEILLLNENKFLLELKNRVETELEEIYSDKIFFDKKYSNVLEKSFTSMKSDYKQDYKLIINSYDNSKNFKKNDDTFLINGYRRHCLREADNEYATHICDSYKGKFILVKDNGKIEFVICSNCKKVYYSNMILCKCYKCNKEYYTEIFTKNEDEFNLPATWENYHCKQIANEEMKCVKCHDKLYINLKSGILNCLNKKCNFSSKPTKILWTCTVCQKDFKTGAIPYNPLDLEVVKRIIKQTLLQKKLAHPSDVPCCKTNVFLAEFHHKKKCAGLLYFGELNNDIVIVCEKCHAINFSDRFIWTCPKCGSKFNDENKKKENRDDKFSNAINSYKTISSEGRKKGFSNSKDKSSNNDDYSSSNSNTSKNKKNQINPINNKIRPFLSNRNRQYKTDIKKKNEDNFSSTIEQPSYLKKLYATKFKSINMYADNSKEKDKEKERVKDNNSKFKIDNKRQNDEKELMNKFKRIKFFTVNDFTNKNKERQKKAEIEKEIKNNNSDEEEGKTNNQRTSFQTFANYRQRRKTEEKMKREEKEKEKEDFIKKRMKEREEKERKEREEREREREREREEREREEREEREREEREREERERERKENEEKKRREKEEREKEEEKEKKIQRYNGKLSGKKIVPYRSFKRSQDKDGAETRTSSKGLEKLKNLEAPSKSFFLKKLKKTEKSSDKQKEDDEKNEKKNKKSYNIKKIEDEPKKEDNNISFKQRWKFRHHELKKPEDKLETESNVVLKRYIEKINTNSKEKIKINKEKEKESKDEKEDNDNNEEDEEEEENKQNNNKTNKNNNNYFAYNPIKKIPGMSDKLLNHVNRRIGNIISKCSIPLMNVEDYILTKKIGEGSYGIIFSVVSKKDKKQYALKKIVSNKLKQIGEFTKEFELVHLCNHDNIMKIYNFCIRILDPTTYALYVLMELAKSDWDKEIKKKLIQKKTYSENELMSIIYQLASALLYIQEKLNLSHRDIKPQNVLVYEGGKYKLADFGEAKKANVSKQMNTLRGTELYMSPALYNGLKNEENDVSHNPYKSDVFSLGFCFLYAAAMNFNLLYQIRDFLDNKNIDKILHKCLKQYSEKLIKMLAAMLDIDENKRWDFKTIQSYIDENYPDLEH